MTKKDVRAIYAIFKFCSWVIGTVCRFVTGIFSPSTSSPNYYRTFFSLHVNAVSYFLAIILIAFSSVSSVVCLTAGNFIFLLLSLVFLAFSIALMYGRVRQKSAFYLPSLIALHTFFSFELCYFSFQVVALILSVNNNVVRGYRSYNSPSVEKQFAQIFLFQLVIGGLCIFGYVSNIIYRDYVYIKNRQKPVTKSSSTPSISIVSKADLEKKEKNDAAGIPRLYI